MSFEDAARTWLSQVAERDRTFYEASWDVAHCGRMFVLRQHMEIRTHHAILSVKSDFGKVGIGSEFCYFLLCEELDERTLDDYCGLVSQLAEADTDCFNRQHDYTFISLVVLTEHFMDKALQRKLKRFRVSNQYHTAEGQYGWNAGRICVVDLTDGEMYFSALGDTLKTRLSGEIKPPASLIEKIKNALAGE